MKRVIIVLAAVWLSACASAVTSGYGQGGRDENGRSYAEARADNQISADVTAALVREPSVPAMGVTVRTYNGVVTLSGSVPTSAASRQATRTASGVAKVKRVDNRLRVTP